MIEETKRQPRKDKTNRELLKHVYDEILAYKLYNRNTFKLTSRSGLGQDLLQVVFGRVISGVGGAGINCLVAIVIAGIAKTATLFFKAN
jgi:hypothetical protein